MDAHEAPAQEPTDRRSRAKQDHVSPYEFWLFVIDQVGRLLRMAIKYGCYAFMAWVFGEAVAELAGKTTIVDVVGSFLVSTARGHVVSLSFVLTGVAGAWGFAERKARQRKVRDLSDRIIDLEKMIDPQRTSSGLTGYGLTHPKDNQG